MASTFAENKALLRRMVDQVLNGKNLDVIPELVAENYIDHNAAAGQQQGIKAFIEARVKRNTAFPDWHVALDEVIAEGDRVVARATGRGTHRGLFMGIAPTGKSVTTNWTVIYRVVDGKLAEHWINSDDLGLLRQLGALP
jgi:predicted ester cyclase